MPVIDVVHGASSVQVDVPVGADVDQIIYAAGQQDLDIEEYEQVKFYSENGEQKTGTLIKTPVRAVTDATQRVEFTVGARQNG